MSGFDRLSPQTVLTAVESVFDLELQPLVNTFPSYVNRVYGLTDSDGEPYVTKFYRPGRWSQDALLEEHQFISELVSDEFPVVPPLEDTDGETLSEIVVESPEGEDHYHFALYPKRAGRLFDAEGEEAWLRIGALCGRLHSVGNRSAAEYRQVVSPSESTSDHVASLLGDGVIPVDMEEDFRNITGKGLDLITPLFEAPPFIRLHGDLHRGNILDRGEEGLLMIDLDDMAMGPAMQDLWLLLPGRADDVRKETALLAEGYEDFRPFPWEQLRLIEPLRLMRMIHFIAWCSKQRNDRDFNTHFPNWGSRGWWIQEIEDLRDQVSEIESALNQSTSF